METTFSKIRLQKAVQFIAFLLFTTPIWAQKNCNNHTTNLVPIMDLAGKEYRGYTGGKYSSGNARPPLQLNRAISQAKKIKPLDTAGLENNNTGKIIFAAVGASNPATEFNKLMQHCDTFKKINKKVKLINTCIGGTGIQKMNESTDNYWVQAYKELKDSGYSAKQVQVIWVEQENTQNADTMFPSAAISLMSDYQKLLSVIYQKFPNVQIVYINQRAFAGYADVTPGAIGKGLHFPRDYYNGWCIKWLIEKQINNEAGYKFQTELPFIDWATSFWADGKNARSDGLSFDCNTDYGSDGLHLSESGERKVGTILFNYFKTDTVSKYWFYTPLSPAGITDTKFCKIIANPNPAKTQLNITTSMPATISIVNTYGQIIYENNFYKLDNAIDVSFWAKGIYFAKVSINDGQVFLKKILIQ